MIFMANENESVDIQQLIGEVAGRHSVLLKRDDPALALVTMNELILKNSLEAVHKQIRATIAEFHASMEKAEKRAGSMLAEKVKESATQMREGLQGDIHLAGLKAREYVHMVNEAHRRSSLLRWVSAGLAAGVLLLGAGMWLESFVKWRF
jgi:hypothetical protein